MNITSASGSGGMNLTHDTLASMGGIVSLVNMLLGDCSNWVQLLSF
ncbi:hypothetical protein [Bacillus thuringiensis]|nr:hypothetical protein [Bacillus thuringiensis]